MILPNLFLPFGEIDVQYNNNANQKIFLFSKNTNVIMVLH